MTRSKRAPGLLVSGLGLILLCAPLGAGGPAGTADPGTPRPPQTVEPAPPLALEFRLVNLEKHASGGVASLILDAAADAALGEIGITIRVPEQISFTDGTRVRTLSVTLAPGARTEIPLELLIRRDGKFTLKAEATTTLRGKPVRRGTAFRLLVGVEEKTPAVKDGAIEYQGVPGDGGR